MRHITTTTKSLPVAAVTTSENFLKSFMGTLLFGVNPLITLVLGSTKVDDTDDTDDEDEDA